MSSTGDVVTEKSKIPFCTASKPGRCTACNFTYPKGTKLYLHFAQGWVHIKCWRAMIVDGMTPRAIRDRIARERRERLQVERDERKLGNFDPATGLPLGVEPPHRKDRKPRPPGEPEVEF